MGWQVGTLIGQSSSINSLCFSPDGKHIVSGSDDNLVKIWDSETGAKVGNFVRVR